jgi:GxxExxY protein
MDDDIRDPQTYAIIGAAMEVHRQLGPGFLEPVYQEAMAIELTLRSIPFVPQLELPVFYKRQRLKSFYKPDFLCYEAVFAELKALQTLTGADEAQTLNYLRATQHERALLINFGSPSMQYRRLIFSNTRKLAQP